MHPTGFVAKDDATIDDWRCAPDGPARFIAPDQLAAVGTQAMQIAIARANVDPVLVKNRAGPDPLFLAGSTQMSACCHIVPYQLAVRLIVGAHDSVFGRGVNHSIGHRGRRIRIGPDFRFPDNLAGNRIEAEKLAFLGAQVNAVILKRYAALDRSNQRLIDKRAIGKVQAVEIMIFAAEINSVFNYGGEDHYFYCLNLADGSLDYKTLVG